jgi:hypothetical protein
MRSTPTLVGPGYERPVHAGKPARRSFTLDTAGSLEVESHHLEKIIVILNARWVQAQVGLLAAIAWST